MGSGGGGGGEEAGAPAVVLRGTQQRQHRQAGGIGKVAPRWDAAPRGFLGRPLLCIFPNYRTLWASDGCTRLGGGGQAERQEAGGEMMMVRREQGPQGG